MIKQIPWNQLEAALLLDAFLKVDRKEWTWKEAISMLYNALNPLNTQKKNITRRGKPVIDFQMRKMQSVYTNGREGLAGSRPERSFKKIVNLYRKNQDAYQELLKDAKKGYSIDIRSAGKLTKTAVPIGSIAEPAGKLKPNVSTIVSTTHSSESFSDCSIEMLKLNSKDVGVLSNIGITTIADILQRKEGEWENIPHFTEGNFKRLKNALEQIGIIYPIEFDSHLYNKYRLADNLLPPVSPNDVDELEKKALYEKPSSSYGQRTAGNDEITKFQSILKKKFSKNGFRVKSPIEREKFKAMYAAEYGEQPAMDNPKIDHILLECGLVHDNFLYVPETMMPKKLKEALFEYIDNLFKKGAPRIYFDALYKAFSNDFGESQITDADMLRSYICYFSDGRYMVGDQYLTKSHIIEGDPKEAIRKCLEEHVGPMKVEEIAMTLPYLTEDRIRAILGSNLEFVRDSKGNYFDADSFYVSDNELKGISDIICNEIKRSGFISGGELYKAIRKKYPSVYEANEVFSPNGWRDALKYKLNDRFSFNGNIISANGRSLSMGEVFSGFARNHTQFTLNELETFAEEVNSRQIYFDSIYKIATRVNENEFVRKQEVSFNVKETDKILDTFCPGEYVPLASVDNLAIFPSASYPWNKYLLEQYVAFYSKKYCLLHTNYGKHQVIGAIVKRSSGLKEYDGLLEKELADRDVKLDRYTALDYLYANGYIGVRRYSPIGKILINARAIRNRKDKS